MGEIYTFAVSVTMPAGAERAAVGATSSGPRLGVGLNAARQLMDN